jgi:predicted pyridoxine 5'-phosphate oxidase superfamily flavin-nucleotide-binding protein
LTGRVNSAGPEGISIDVDHTFGNCPKYIQTRAVEVRPSIDTPRAERPTTVSDRFDADVRALIERADTLFIATAYLDGPETAARGADVSHRGGKPGFVRIDDDRTFVLPDFSGNLHFNTVGNILSNPKAGFLFVDFDSGDLIYMTGQAEIVWDGAEIEAFAGAERLIRFQAEKVIRVEASLPLRFEFGEYSPNLERTGSWQQAELAT